MFYFPLIETRFPTWFPLWGGQEFVFFRPVFNIADSAISVGIVAIFIFYRSFFDDKKEEVTSPQESVTEGEATNSVVEAGERKEEKAD
jgi:signal peptidase II